MQNKFKNKYRVPSTRLQSWDYSNNGAYFITICTLNRNHFFGKISNGNMQLSDMGKFAERYWLEIPTHFPFIELGNFVVMPNHVHGILIINTTPKSVETRFIASKKEENIIASKKEENIIASKKEENIIASKKEENIIASKKEENKIASKKEEKTIASLPENTGGFSGDKNPMINDNISKIIRWYKGRCSFEIRKTYSNFAWQSRFHDHIIRNSKSFENIQNYIFENPSNWQKDKFYEKSTPKL